MEGDRVKIRHIILPEVFVATDGQSGATRPFVELERARPNRMRPNILTMFLSRRGRCHQASTIREKGKKRRVRRGEVDCHGQVIHDLDAVDNTLELPTLRRITLRVEARIEVPLHGLGIERRTVVELNATTQI